MAAPASAPAQRLPAGIAQVIAVEGITEYRLGNGMQLLLVPDDSKPTTTVNLTFRVGSRHENYGETGMAHLLEHLIFKGTPKTRNVWAEFTKRGLRANGTTSNDRTNYFASFAANEDNLHWYLGWQADAMVNSFIAKKDLDSEMTVVRNEMEMGENDPSRILWQRALATMFDWHNYGKTTIGARADVENVDIGRLQAFYRSYYQPDNATLVVSGKFEVQKVLAWVSQSFGRIPKPKRVLPRLYTLDTAQDGERAFTLRRNGGAPLLIAAYHAPPAAHPDFAAVEALALILSDNPSGRLFKRLVQKQLAASVWGWSWDLHDPGVMMFGAQLAPDQDLDVARRELIAALESFALEPVTAEELNRARVSFLKAWDQRFTNPETVGVALSDAVAQGDWRLFFLIRDRVRGLTLEQVQRVAMQRLLRSNRTSGSYVPTELPQRAPAPARVDVAEQLKDFKPSASLALAEAFEATPANIDARTQRTALASGMKLALLPKGTRGNAVRATLVLRYGDEQSLKGQRAVAEMVGALLDKGTSRLSRQQIRDRIDALQGEVGFDASAERLVVSMSTKREHLPALVGLVGELLRESNFPPEALQEVKAQALASVEEQRKEPEAMAANALERHGNPYPRGDVRHARSFDEIVADTGAVTVEQLREFHRRFYGASFAQFAAVGDFDVAATRAALESAFGTWKSGQAFQRVPQPAVEVAGTRLQLKAPDKQNAALMARQSVPLNDTHADYPAFMLANWLLGAGGDSRLWKRIREKDGLSYSIQSYVQWNPFEPDSEWNVEGIFAPQNGKRVEAAFKEEVVRAIKDGFSADEVKAGLRGLLNYRKLGRAQDTGVAGLLASNLYLDRTLAQAQKVDEAIAGLTAAQVNAALRKYLQPAKFVFVFAGDFKE